MNKNIFLLSLAFGLIFFAFSGTQQFLTIIYERLGNVSLGFWVLIVLYASFTIFNFLAPKLIEKLGLKATMMIGSLAYAAFIVGPAFASIEIMFALSVFLGLGAAMLWNAQGVYLVLAADKVELGTASGFFSTLWGLGSVAGIALTGQILEYLPISLNQFFIVASLFPVLGSITLIGLKQVKITGKPQPLISSMATVFKLVRSKTLNRLSLIWILMIAQLTFSFSVMPLLIEQRLGAAIAGILGALPYLAMVGFSLVSGVMIDRIGRKQIIIWGIAISLLGLAALLQWTQLALIAAAILLAIGFALMRTLTFVLVEDISTKQLLAPVNAYLYVISNLTVIAVLWMGRIGLRQELVIPMIILSVGILVISLPVLSLPGQPLKKRIVDEVSS